MVVLEGGLFFLGSERRSPEMCPTVPGATRNERGIIERPSTRDDKLGVLVINGEQTRHPRRRIRRPSVQSQHDTSHTIEYNSHSTAHVIARARKSIRRKIAPFDLAHCIFVSCEFFHACTRAPRTIGRRNGVVGGGFDHPTIPDAHKSVDRRRSEDVRLPFIPIERKDL